MCIVHISIAKFRPVPNIVLIFVFFLQIDSILDLPKNLPGPRDLQLIVRMTIIIITKYHGVFKGFVTHRR